MTLLLSPDQPRLEETVGESTKKQAMRGPITSSTPRNRPALMDPRLHVPIRSVQAVSRVARGHVSTSLVLKIGL